MCVFDYVKEVWSVDWEYFAPSGENPLPVCMCARELFSRKSIQLWRDELAHYRSAPFNIGADAVYVGFSTSADLGCFLQLGWKLPTNVWDLYVENLRLTNPRPKNAKTDLNTVLDAYGIPEVNPVEKREMRELAMSNGPFNQENTRRMQHYCQNDADSNLRLLLRMEPRLDHIDRVGRRGRYMRSLARVNHYGLHVDVEMIRLFGEYWERILLAMIEEANRHIPVFDDDGSLRHEKLEAYVEANQIPWPRTITGLCRTKGEDLKELANMYPAVGILREVLSTRNQARIGNLAIGKDGRCRTWYNPFGQKAGRNNPAANESVFNLASWFRGVIKPGPGMAICYLDYEAQEFAVAAALARDQHMMGVYQEGDPYIATGKRIGLIPLDGEDADFKRERSLCKTLTLGLNYGMSVEGFARRTGLSYAKAKPLYDRLCGYYSAYRAWSKNQLDTALLRGYAVTKYGWTRRVIPEDRNPRSLVNFPIQGHGGEILRGACYRCTEHGIRVIGLVHDAILVEASEADIQDVVEETERHMIEASMEVLDGFPIRVEHQPATVYPNRYREPKEGAAAMWDKVTGYLSSFSASEQSAPTI